MSETRAFSPTSGSERIEAIDVVRGFALFGVLLANVVWWTQDMPLTDAQRDALPTATADKLLRGAIGLVIDGKFYTLFSFLFGLGFAVYLERGQARGTDSVPLFRRRLLVLLAIGLTHNFLLWAGDILHLYALLGLLLPLVRRWSQRRLLWVGLLLAVVVPVALRILMRVAFEGGGAEQAAEKLEQQQAWAALTGTWPEVLRYHLASTGRFYTSSSAADFVTSVAGRFLLGFWAGRCGLLHQPAEHRPLLRRFVLWGLILGIPGNGLAVAREAGAFGEDFTLPVRVMLASAVAVGVLALAAAYLGTILLWLQRAGAARWLRWLAPVGRMALTNYLVHSCCFVLVFYRAGLGLIGHVGTTFCLCFAIVVFAAQLALSRWWLARFRFGPMEWAWRSLTYGKLMPMRGAATGSSG